MGFVDGVVVEGFGDVVAVGFVAELLGEAVPVGECVAVAVGDWLKLCVRLRVGRGELSLVAGGLSWVCGG